MSVPLTRIEKLSHLLVEWYEKMSFWEQDVLRGSGLSTAQMHTVEIVGHGVSLQMKELARKMGVTTGTLTVMVDRLEEQGLLQRTPHETDRRSWLIELTEKGQVLFGQHHQYHLRLTEEITSALSSEEQEMFSAILEKIVGQM
ncbi:MAG: MarR family transcriptional regulator [Proteobacteria bacterium]|jgi:DNA-binding MarR family transcriptional regulator|nr:MarR family transcriptional regulator [Desulfocapsa sp.]MBU3944533.1 MarR family transcriptional regulator [Pseudomonadota bacterium]MCG2744120.1 MarR family transcriptional regulator [Desulfobacteraceae bacterium]MBU3983393.1 MarR family transcriptional regulator [Pseudomonadota bacterium]MBU4028122.1 MarR family transcriptional regulator [Pseudomonadota bacterium]